MMPDIIRIHMLQPDEQLRRPDNGIAALLMDIETVKIRVKGLQIDPVRPPAEIANRVPPLAGPEDKDIAPAPANQIVSTTATDQPVIPGSPLEEVITATSHQEIPVGSPFQGIITGGTFQNIPPEITDKPVITLAAE